MKSKRISHKKTDDIYVTKLYTLRRGGPFKQSIADGLKHFHEKHGDTCSVPSPFKGKNEK